MLLLPLSGQRCQTLHVVDIRIMAIASYRIVFGEAVLSQFVQPCTAEALCMFCNMCILFIVPFW